MPQGAGMLDKTRHELGEDNMMLQFASEIARHHHERWDGSGYPDGLQGEAIPLAARLMAVADVYDALRSVRPYKTAFSHEAAVRMVEEQRGRHFDPALINAFIVLKDEFSRIATQLADDLPSRRMKIRMPIKFNLAGAVAGRALAAQAVD